MNSLPSECPICQADLTVTRLHCRECDTRIEGRFVTGPFAQLSPAQVEFVEIFIRNEGKITRMEGELGLSYPTIRNRLHEVIRSLGYEPGGAEEIVEMSGEERRQILEDINQGRISTEDAMQLLKEKEV